MATIQGQSGPQILSDGVNTTVRTGRTGEINTSDAHARYQEAIYRGNVYSLSAAAAAPTAYVGAAAGVPLLSIHNPTGSGKILVLLAVMIGGRATATGAGTTDLMVWSGPSATPTGTATVPINQLSLVAGASVGRGAVNTALTSSTALTNNFPLFSYYWATAAGAILSPSLFELGGLIVAAPGNQFNVGVSVALTSATYDVAMIWEEILV